VLLLLLLLLLLLPLTLLVCCVWMNMSHIPYDEKWHYKELQDLGLYYVT